jgi:hypothetical protein
MSFFPKKGWIYIIINSLAPSVFKMGCSTSPIIDENGKLIGRCRGYYNHFPVGKWKLVFSKEVDDMSYTERQLISFFSKECMFENIDDSKEWFVGDWKKIKLFSFDLQRTEQRKIRPSELVRIKKAEKNDKGSKLELANRLIKIGITNSDIRYKIYNRLKIHSISDLRIYESKFGSILNYLIKENKQTTQFEKIREILSKMYTNHSVNMILSKINENDLDKILAMSEKELLRTLM